MHINFVQPRRVYSKKGRNYSCGGKKGEGKGGGLNGKRDGDKQKIAGKRRVVPGRYPRRTEHLIGTDAGIQNFPAISTEEGAGHTVDEPHGARMLNTLTHRAHMSLNMHDDLGNVKE